MKAFFDIEFERQGKNGKGIRFVDGYYIKKQLLRIYNKRF